MYISHLPTGGADVACLTSPAVSDSQGRGSLAVLLPCAVYGDAYRYVRLIEEDIVSIHACPTVRLPPCRRTRIGINGTLPILLYGIQLGAAAISVQVVPMSPREEPSGSHKLAEQTLTAVCQEVIEFPVNLKLSGDLPMTRYERTPDVE